MAGMAGICSLLYGVFLRITVQVGQRFQSGWGTIPLGVGHFNRALLGHFSVAAKHLATDPFGGTRSYFLLKMHFLAPSAARSTLPALPPWERQSSPQLSQFSPIDYPLRPTGPQGYPPVSESQKG